MIIGDFNYPDINWDMQISEAPEDSPSQSFLSVYNDCFLHQHVLSPTHYVWTLVFSARLRVLYGEFAREFLPILTVLATVFRRNIWYSLSLCSSLVCSAFYLANVLVTLENF